MTVDSTTPPSTSPPPGPRSPVHRVPRKAGDFGMILFLVALGVLFASSMLGYVVVRISKTRTVLRPGTDEVAVQATAPSLGSLRDAMPVGLFVSTLVILASSVTIHLALKNVQRERQGRFRGWLIATLGLSLLFLLVQTPSMILLVGDHFDAGSSNTVLGLIFFLILLHALHVLGGLIPLCVATYRAGQDRYDHEHYAPIKHLTMYWHFLDVVWVVMFGVLLLTG